MTDLLPRHRVTVDEYYRMGETGLIAPDVRTELIEGEVIEMPPIGSPHAAAVSQLQDRLFFAIEGRAQLRVQNPVRLDNYSEPQPDLAVLLSRKDFYRERRAAPVDGRLRPCLLGPLSPDTLLVIEVSDSSLRFDRDVKVPLYAQNRIPEVWIVDLEHNRIHFFRSPRNVAYTDVSHSDKPEAVALAALPDVRVDLSGLFAS